MEKTSETIEERIAKHSDSVKKLEESYGKNPSDDLQLELNRERDTLRHLTNTQTGTPKERAQKSSDLARQYALGKAIEQVPQE